MLLTRAKTKHLAGINALISFYNLAPITEDFIKYDISIIAEDKGKIVGFIWCGLMANRKLGYIDYFTVHPEYASTGIGRALGTQLVRIAKNKGVDLTISIIERGQYHDKSVSSAQHIGLQPATAAFTAMAGKVEVMSTKLGV